MSALDGRCCVVTGASGLIGRAICETLASQGGTVIGVCRTNRHVLDALAESPGIPAGSITPWLCDLTAPDQPAAAVQAIVERTGRIDVLVCCAGQTVRQPVLLTPDADIDRLLALNVRSTFQLCRLALRPMLRQRSGRIVLIGSRAGEHGLPGQAVYGGSKAALHAFAKALAFEVGDKGITVNAVAPGAIADGGTGVYSRQDEARALESIGLRRLGTPEEVAAVVAFLASPAASYVSGAVIPVDGAGRL